MHDCVLSTLKYYRMVVFIVSHITFPTVLERRWSLGKTDICRSAQLQKVFPSSVQVAPPYREGRLSWFDWWHVVLEEAHNLIVISKRYQTTNPIKVKTSFFFCFKYWDIKSGEKCCLIEYHALPGTDLGLQIEKNRS